MIISTCGRIPLITFATLWLVGSAAFAQDADPPDYFDPARFEADIRAFEHADSTSEYQDGSVLFYGSSSIRFWHDSLAQDMAPLKVIPRGFGGSTMIDALSYLDRVVMPVKPSAVVLYEGDNDIGQHHVSPQRVTELFKAFVEKLRGALPETQVHFLSIKPSPSRWNYWSDMEAANRMIEAVCASDSLLHYVDVATPMLTTDGRPDKEIFLDDMLHMNRKGYEIWKRIVREALDLD